MKYFKNKFILSFLVFILLNLLLYAFIFLFNNRISFNKYNYIYNAHHYIQDTRVTENKFDLLNALGQFDAQWYLKIADSGYSKNPGIADNNNKNNLSGLDYAFFPFFPLLVFIPNLIIKNVSLSAFLVVNLFLILDFISLYYFVRKFFSETIAIRTTFLLFSFPFGIFYRSYFAETIFLFFLIWFSYFFMLNKYIISSFLLGILNFVKGNAILVNVIFLYYFLIFVKHGNLQKNIKTIFISACSIGIPFLIWFIYVSIQTHNPLYFLNVRSEWLLNEFPVKRFVDNISHILFFANLRTHFFHSSQIDVIVFAVTFIVLLLSRKKLPKKIWLISLSLWLTPLLFSDLMSFSRHQSVSFPLFIYLSEALSSRAYKLLLLIFLIGLFAISLYFVNWYWIG